MSITQEFRDFVAAVVSFPQDFLGAFGLPPSESGAIVNEFSAIQIASYFACIRVIADAVGSLPLKIYERKPDGSEVVAYDHSLFPLLHTQPNPDVVAADYRQTAQTHILMTGNCYGEIVRNRGGQPVAIYLRSPFTTFPYRRRNTGELYYVTHDDPSGGERGIEAPDMLHVKGMGIDSLIGLSPVKYYAREILGIDISAQAYSAKYFANSATPSGYLQAPANLKPEQKLAAMQTWLQAHGRGNYHMPAVLEGGWKWENTGVNPDEAQLIQLRGFNREQICSIFGVPEHMVGGKEDTKANAEQKAREFLIFCIKPWLRKWEQVINSKLFPSMGRTAGKFFAKFDTTEMEQADYKTMIQGLQMARYAGLITAQEGRKALGYNPYEPTQLKSDNPADRLLQPVNMVFVGEDTLDVPDVPTPGKDTESEGEAPPVAPKDSPSVTEKNSVDREVKHYMRTFGPAFADALRRMTARRKPDNADFQRTLTPILTSIAAAFAFSPDADEPGEMHISAELAGFVREYVNGVEVRAPEWDSNRLTEIAAKELHRYVIAVRAKAQPVTIQ